MNTALTLICATCNAPISPEDLAQGLAVRVDGQTICPMCVDLLPGRAQFEINKLRALKGFNATTYRVIVPRHQDHQRFTFTTAGNVMGHYRTLHNDGEFVAPLLPDSARQQRHPSRTAARAPSGIFAPSTSTASAPSPEARATPWLIYAVVGCGLLLCVLIGVAIWQQQARSQPIPHVKAVVVAKPQRTDYPSDPLAAWEMATTDGHCPTDIVQMIDQQLRQQLTTDLDQAQGDISQHAFTAADTDLAAVHVPDDPAFAALRGRARELTALLSSQRQVKVVVTTSPATSDPAIDPPQVPKPPEVVVPIPKPPPAPVHHDVSGECWLIPSSELMPAGATDWKRNGELIGATGHLERTLPPLRGGTYQVWVHANIVGSSQGSLILLIDGQIIDTLNSRQAGGFMWHALSAQTNLNAGSHQFQIEAAGSGWRVTQIYLASLEHGPPESWDVPPSTPWPTSKVGNDDAPPKQPRDNQAQNQKPATDSTSTTPVMELERFVQEYKPVYAWPKNLQDEPLDGSTNLPSPWPSGGTPFVRAQSFTDEGCGALVLRLLKKDVINGGVTILVHPMRIDRKSLAVRLEWTPSAAEVEAKTPNFIDLSTLDFASETWQVFAISFPDLSKMPNQLRLRLSDSVNFGPDLRGFLLGSAVTIANGPPTVQDLHLLSSPLLSSDIITDTDYQRKLIAILTQVAANRHGGHTWKESRYLNPLLCRIVIAGLNKDWQTIMRSRLQRINCVIPQHGWFAALDADPQWFDDLESADRIPVVDSADVSLAVVMLNGEEGLNRLKAPAQLLHWVRKVCTDLIDGAQGKGGGVLPVFVIGATTAVTVAGQQQAIDKAWNQVMEFCFENGIPLLDIRNAQFAEGATPDHLSARLLGDGLQSLIYQLRWLQRNVKQ